jgi:predicted dinucleotide-binding enzyme
MDIAIIGAGNVGAALAAGWTKKNHKIHLGLRNPEDPKHAALKARLKTAVFEAPAAAAKAASVIVLATPWAQTEAAVRSLGDLAGKIVIDCTNPLKPDLSGLTHGHTTSAAELIQSWIPQARVVKAFNTVGANIMEHPDIRGLKAVMYFCGNDVAARQTVKGLITDIGFEPVEAGDLTQARLLEPMAMLWIKSAYTFGLGRDFAFGLLKAS